MTLDNAAVAGTIEPVAARSVSTPLKLIASLSIAAIALSLALAAAISLIAWVVG